MSWSYIGHVLAPHRRFEDIADTVELCTVHVFGAGCIERADVRVRDAGRHDVATFCKGSDYDYTDRVYIGLGFAHGFD